MPPTCAVCESAFLREIAGFERLPRVTSDCKPWPAGGQLHCCTVCGAAQKIADPSWFGEIKEIYANYQIYHLSAGAEQVVFVGGSDALPRSRTLVDFVVSRAALPAHGRLIDIGCGNGAALANFSRALPQWRLFGSELDDGALANLRMLPNFDTLYTTDLSKIPGQFEVVVMIHALEHMPVPYDTLVASRDRLVENGTLFIEIPDFETSPFDILVVDHHMHFTRMTLGHLVARAGMTPVELTNRVLPKEITLLARRAQANADTRLDPHIGQRLVEANVQWLSAVQHAADKASRVGRFGIFGTSVAGMWLYGGMRDRVEFFVDEDRTRIGQSFEGRPILSPEQVPEEATVFVPLAPLIAASVVARLSVLPTHFLTPPEFPI